MIERINHIFLLLCFFIFFYSHNATAGGTPIQKSSASPFKSSILLNATTGKVLFEKNADTIIYPAATLQLMVLLVIQEEIERGNLNSTDMVQISVAASNMGGSQVYLETQEQFSIEDLLYALIIQSANDAAVALAEHVAGSQEAFVALMNRKAKELGMRNTQFHSVHGLPPSMVKRLTLVLQGILELFVVT